MKHTLLENANYVLGFLGAIVSMLMYGMHKAVLSGIFMLSYETIWMLFMAGLVFIGLIVGKVISKLHYWAYRDFLTGVWNRKYFVSKMRYELKRKLQINHKLCIALLDMDDFKKVNDSYGHAIGDVVIKDVAKTIQENITATDSVIRLGGDEFAIIFSNKDLRKAKLYADRIRYLVAKQSQYITVSIGLIEVTKSLSFDETMKTVDQVLYEAKHKKNSVCTSLAG